MILPSNPDALTNLLMKEYEAELVGGYRRGFVSTAPAVACDAKRTAEEEGVFESVALLIIEQRETLELNAASDEQLRRYVGSIARLAGKKAGRKRIGKHAVAATMDVEKVDPIVYGEKSVLDQIISRRNQASRRDFKKLIWDLKCKALAELDGRDRCVWTEKNEDKRKWEGVRRKRQNRWGCPVTVEEIKDRYFRAHKRIGERMRVLAEEYFS